MNNILVVGQTPPPYGGQAIMIQAMLEGAYPGTRLHHLRMSYSAQMDEVGRFNLRKIGHLLWLIYRTWQLSRGEKVRVLYYPPAGPQLVPVLRDIAYLLAVRRLFHVRIFHFHASGLSGYYRRQTGLLRWLMRLAYFAPEISICASRLVNEDGDVLQAKRSFIIPLGIADDGRAALETRASAQVPTILYVGVLRDDKGILILLEAFRILLRSGRAAFLDLVGHFASTSFERDVRAFIAVNALEDKVRLRGVLTGNDKWQAYSDADVFCFPTHFASESFGVCLVEAMSFGLPIVATRWRSIPDIVDEGETGFLVPVEDSAAMAARLGALVDDPALRLRMGRSGRDKFLGTFTLEKYHARMNAMFQSIQTERLASV